MKGSVIASVGVLGVAAVIAYVASRLPLSSLPDPGPTEFFLMTKAKHYLVQGNREHVPSPPADRQAAAKEGEKLFGTDCAVCHGLDGRNPTDAGRWMYPRAANLASHESQSYSDHEVFWIIKNGIRLSGMPAFGRVESEEHIWDLVFFIRTLPRSPGTNAGYIDCLPSDSQAETKDQSTPKPVC